jgi:hypothetical protein
MNERKHLLIIYWGLVAIICTMLVDAAWVFNSLYKLQGGN